ncbi:MAG: ABC transporter transmembrane domain-containing protein [Rhodothalassiaceae bacterium]
MTQPSPDPAAVAAPAGGLSRLKRLRLLVRFAAPYRWWVAAALVSLVLSTGASLTLVYTLKPLIDRGFSGDDAAAIDVYFLQLLLVAAVLAMATASRFYFVTVLGERVVADLRRAVHRRLLHLQPRFFDDNRPGELSSRLTSDTTVIQSVLGSSVSIALRNLLTFIGGLAMLIYTNAALMGSLAIAIPLVIVPVVVLGRQVRKLARKSQDRLADVGARATETYGAIRIVQAFRQERREADRFAQTVDAAFAIARQRIAMRAVLTVTVILLIFAAIDLILWQGAKQVVAGDMTGGEMAAFVAYAIMVATAAGAVIEVYGDLQRAAGASERLRELLDMTSGLALPAVPRTLPHKLSRAVRFEAVSFAYEDGRPALSGIDLDIAAGEMIALVGPSGAGKSTLFHLLQRFDDPSAGRILIDGTDIRHLSLEGLRSQMAMVPQDVLLFADTIRENVRYARPQADDAAVHRALEIAHAMEFVERLPEGLDTILGERGARLSGGQKARLAIARAVLADAPILLLDEATAALDAHSERQVQAALAELMEGRTSLIIAHRLATVRDADRIMLMRDGRLIDIAPHDTLMARSELYQDMVQLQALAERPLSEAG